MTWMGIDAVKQIRLSQQVLEVADAEVKLKAARIRSEAAEAECEQALAERRSAISCLDRAQHTLLEMIKDRA